MDGWIYNIEIVKLLIWQGKIFFILKYNLEVYIHTCTFTHFIYVNEKVRNVLICLLNLILFLIFVSYFKYWAFWQLFAQNNVNFRYKANFAYNILRI